MMEYKGYIGKVEFDAEAKILHGEVVGIRDVVTFQGNSVKEVEKAFRDSVDDYLAYCKERGEAPDKPCSGQFVVRIGSDLHRKVNMLASVCGTSLNSFVAEALLKQVEHEWVQLSKTKPGPRHGTARQRKERRLATR